MISKELSATLGFAVREAKKRRHEYVSIEHVLLEEGFQRLQQVIYIPPAFLNDIYPRAVM